MPAGDLLLLLLLLQAGSPERFVFRDRTEREGVSVGLPAPGQLRIRTGDGALRDLALEDVARIVPAGEPAAPRPDSTRVEFSWGGVLIGRLVSANADGVVVEGGLGVLTVRRGHLRTLLLGPLPGPLPELRETAGEILVREAAPGELEALYGRLVSIGEAAEFDTEAGERKRIPRPELRQVIFRGEEPAAALPGLYARVTLRDGQTWQAVLESAGEGSYGFFSTAFGPVEVPKRAVRSLSFSSALRVGKGTFLIAETGGVREIDRTGRERWRYKPGLDARAARRLENGHVLIVFPQTGEVTEVRPRGKGEADLISKLAGLAHPYDAVRLPDGRTVVAEYNAGHVAEYDRDENRAWTFAIPSPIGLQLLEQGTILAWSRQKVVEIARGGRPVWEAELRGIRPSHAHRLENGNTLLADAQGDAVLEIDPRSAVVWRRGGFQGPGQVYQRDDGSTLVLEQRNARIVELEPGAGDRSAVILRGLQGIQGFSTD
jgi:hypothetical protein